MAFDLAGVQTRAQVLIQDSDADLLDATPDMDEAARQAVAQYSKDAPAPIIADLAGDGSTFEYALPTGFVDGLSRVLTLEYPAGQRPAALLDPAHLEVYRTATTTKLRFVEITPASGETARVTFAGRHTLKDLDDATETSIPAYHEDAFVTLTAAQAMFILAAHYLHEQENTIAVDTVDRGSRTDTANRIARGLLASYRDLIGVRAGVAAASTRVQWGSAYAPGVARLTHGRGRW